MPIDLAAILRHLQHAELVHLRTGQPPRFWSGAALIDDQGRFDVLTTDSIKRLICVPLNDDQLRAFRSRCFVSIPLGVAGIGSFRFEAYVQAGLEEVVIVRAESAESDVWFRQWMGTTDYRALGEALADDEPHLAWRAFERARASDLEIAELLGYKLRRVDDAIEAYTRAIESPDPDPDAFFGLAVMLRSSHRLHDAEAVVRRGLRVHEDRDLVEALAVILIELERKAEAIPLLESLLAAGPDPELEGLLAEATA